MAARTTSFARPRPAGAWVGALLVLAAVVAAALAYGLVEDKTTVTNTPANTPPSVQQPPTAAPDSSNQP